VKPGVKGVLVKVQTTWAPVFPEAAGKSSVNEALLDDGVRLPLWIEVDPLRQAYVMPYWARLAPSAPTSLTV